MSSLIEKENLVVVILAGGQSIRMGKNIFKPVVKLEGKPLWLYVYQNLQKLSSEVLVIVKSAHQEELIKKLINDNKIKVIIDSFEFSSPLAGILTAAQNTTKEGLVPVGADQIFLSQSVIANLLSHIDNQTDAVVPRWPNGYIEPLGAVYKRMAIDRFIKNNFDINEVSLHGFLQNISVKYVDIFSITDTPELTYFNINTLNDLKKAKRVLSRIS